MAKLHEYGGRIVTVDGQRTVEMRDSNDNARTRYQYRRSSDGGLERRRLTSAGGTLDEWTAYTADELAQLRSQRGQFHPILDPLGL